MPGQQSGYLFVDETKKLQQKFVMRSKKTILRLVLFSLLLGWNAKAFYNPAKGTWLNRDPLQEAWSQLVMHTMWDKPEQSWANVAATVASKTLNMGRSRLYSISMDERLISKRPVKPSSEFIEYQFCHNEPVNRFDTDGRADTPGCGVWAVPLAAGLFLALSDQIYLARECNYLAEHQDQESYGRTLNTRIDTLGLSFLVYEHCPQGGSIYLHVWMENCNCKHNYVIICDKCSPGA